MKVVLTTSYVTAETENHEGDEIEVADEVGVRLVESGSATPVGVTPAGGREKASRSGRETR